MATASSAERDKDNDQHLRMAEEMQGRYAPVIRTIHDSPIKAVMFLTGGASQALGWLLSEPGASQTVLECQVPYCTSATVKLLPQEPEQFCSRETAVALALEAHRHAASLSSLGTPVVGLAATCGLISGPKPKRGDHRVWVAVHGNGVTTTYGLNLAKGARSRVGEDLIASQVVLKALADSCELGDDCSVPIDLLKGDITEELQVQKLEEEGPLEQLLAGKVKTVEYSGGRVLIDSPRPGLAYMSGSFNPLHEGHEKVLSTACEMLGREGCFELAVCNADKGALSQDVVESRIKQFVDRSCPIVLTMEPFFTGKAEVFHDSVFVVGYDTAIRLVNTKYYKSSEVEMARQFARLEARGCSFAVAGRLDGDTFRGLEDMQVPEFLKPVFQLSIPEEKLRVDISSTEIRKRMAAEQTGSK
eukprot:CAMPEP_0117683236 /NCGR_PEP_ID=MMETSP0804-20121206/20250_1 /TAXON_ID=1074897 /ORGANISM="Tetraselmis astigmatica, Strain CCMP880" /LENGTH=416 /DNA_ID=CAMNT_0005493731 /DNA_START=199 /DNA_END=1449 /DNA_ORIENTATION=-